MWGSPLVSKAGSDRVKQTAKPPSKPIEPEKFKMEKLTLPKSEAKKILHYSGNLSVGQTLWTQNWLNQRIRERSLPPQLSGHDAFGSIVLFLSPSDVTSLLEDIRKDFQRTLPLEPKESSEFDFLMSLANEAYHEHLPPPTSASHNNHLSDDDQ
jgi:hypothetical protein